MLVHGERATMRTIAFFYGFDSSFPAPRSWSSRVGPGMHPTSNPSTMTMTMIFREAGERPTSPSAADGLSPPPDRPCS